MSRMVLVLCFVLMLVLLVAAALYFYTLGYLHREVPWPPYMMQAYYIPYFTLVVTAGILAVAFIFSFKKKSMDDRVVVKPKVLKLIFTLYILAIIFMVIIAQWAGSTVHAGLWIE